MGPTLVLGHRNPDNDSICSAVAYAHLKNVTDHDNVYVPARLGSMPAETEWVFDHFGLEPPLRLSHVHTRVRDAMAASVVTIGPDDPMLSAGRLMREHDVRALPVIDVESRVLGLVSQRMLAERYIEETEISGFAEQPVSVARLVRVLDGSLVTGDAHASVNGKVLIGAAEPETMAARIEPGDLVILGDRLRTQPIAIEAGAAVLVLTTGAIPGDKVVAQARERGAAIIVTERDTYSAARLVALAHAVSDHMEVDVLKVGPDTLLSEAAEDLLASHHREAVVIENDLCVGMLTRTDIARGIRRKVVLVDHNEAGQSAAGIEEAAIVEIVDHHRLGDLQTPGPILFLNLPVGATATIVANRYEMLDVEMPTSIAGILLAAILTDTVLLKSPTTTQMDRRAAGHLAQMCGVDIETFGIELFRSRTRGQAFDARTVVRADAKDYRIGDTSAVIAQYESVDLSEFDAHLDEIRSVMDELREQRGYDLVVLMATDIVREGSRILASGKTRLVERGLGITLEPDGTWMPGVLSRKKQIAAALVEAAGR